MPILVHTGNGEKTLQQHPELLNVPNFPDLNKAVEYVLSREEAMNKNIITIKFIYTLADFFYLFHYHYHHL